MKDTVTHLTLLASVTLSLVKENQELKEVVGKKNQQIDEMEHELRQKMAASEAETRKSFAGLRQSVHNKFQAHDKVDREVQKLKTSVQQLTFHKLGLPVSFRVR